MMALTKLSLSRAYPIMASAPIIIVLLSTIFLKEDLTLGKLIGSLLILLGIYLAVKF
jgi:drug/metabolite transporter (DMT)-like permease